MPSSFARGVIKTKFGELINALEMAIEEDRSRGNSQGAEQMVEVLNRVREAETDFDTMGNPQGGSSG